METTSRIAARIIFPEPVLHLFPDCGSGGRSLVLTEEGGLYALGAPCDGVVASGRIPTPEGAGIDMLAVNRNGSSLAFGSGSDLVTLGIRVEGERIHFAPLGRTPCRDARQLCYSPDADDRLYIQVPGGVVKARSEDLAIVAHLTGFSHDRPDVLHPPEFLSPLPQGRFLYQQGSCVVDHDSVCVCDEANETTNYVHSEMDADFYRAAGLANGRIEAISVVKDHRSQLVIAPIPTRETREQAEPRSIDLTPQFGEYGFEVAARADGAILGIWRPPTPGILLLDSSLVGSGAWIPLPGSPLRVAFHAGGLLVVCEENPSELLNVTWGGKPKG